MSHPHHHGGSRLRGGSRSRAAERRLRQRVVWLLTAALVPVVAALVIGHVIGLMLAACSVYEAPGSSPSPAGSGGGGGSSDVGGKAPDTAGTAPLAGTTTAGGGLVTTGGSAEPTPVGGADDGNGSITEAIHLVEATRLEARWHQKEIGAGFDAM